MTDSALVCKTLLPEAKLTCEERLANALGDTQTKLSAATRLNALRAPRVVRLVYALSRALPPGLRQLVKPTLRRLWYGAGCRRMAAVAACGSASAADGERYRIVCFPVIDWELRTQRPQQVLSRLAARGCSVLYLRNDFRRGRGAEPTSLLPSQVVGLRLPGPAGLTIYGAPPPPALVDAWIEALEPHVLGDAPIPTVALVQWPFWTSLALEARRRWGWPIVYDCIDDHSTFTGTRPDVVALEQRLVGSSAAVITTSRGLLAKWDGSAKRCLYVPNGADVEHFAPAESPRRSGARTRPRIGYIGALANWFDAELVRAAALAYPDWQFELIGMDSGADLRPLSHLRNVRLAGEVPYDDLPAMLHRLDVTMVPFKVNRLTTASNPVKVYEYLAAGKPVVSVCLPELEQFGDSVYLARDREAFVRLIGVALKADSPEQNRARISLARANDWSYRVTLLDSEFRRALSESPTRSFVAAASQPAPADRAAPVPLRAAAHFAVDGEVANPAAGRRARGRRVAVGIADRDGADAELTRRRR